MFVLKKSIYHCCKAFVYLDKIGNYQQTSNAITKKNGQKKTETTLTLDVLDLLIKCLIWLGLSNMKLSYELFLSFHWVAHISLIQRERVIKKLLRKRKLVMNTKRETLLMKCLIHEVIGTAILILREFPILFLTVKLKLGNSFSQFIHRLKIWILKCWS